MAHHFMTSRIFKFPYFFCFDKYGKLKLKNRSCHIVACHGEIIGLVLINLHTHMICDLISSQYQNNIINFFRINYSIKLTDQNET